jgi:putative Mn2+ efflux pump MntP
MLALEMIIGRIGLCLDWIMSVHFLKKMDRIESVCVLAFLGMRMIYIGLQDLKLDYVISLTFYFKN